VEQLVVLTRRTRRQRSTAEPRPSASASGLDDLAARLARAVPRVALDEGPGVQPYAVAIDGIRHYRFPPAFPHSPQNDDRFATD
jgi:hypothetical protein